MSTKLPSKAYPKEVRDWWSKLGIQKRIVHALRAYEEMGGGTLLFKVAESPGKYAEKAYKLRHIAWHEPQVEGK